MTPVHINRVLREVRAFDGVAWSDPDSIPITTMGPLGGGGFIF